MHYQNKNCPKSFNNGATPLKTPDLESRRSTKRFQSDLYAGSWVEFFEENWDGIEASFGSESRQKFNTRSKTPKRNNISQRNLQKSPNGSSPKLHLQATAKQSTK